ncbi:Mannose-6-phosphate isomerase [Gonapodya sp. JEL0774]|nr:Mannose-6-phosphate isomerase [Gonapodya sp. JEL0774]
MDRFFRLHGQVMCYDWGVPGHASMVAKLASGGSGVSVDEQRPYAEVLSVGKALSIQAHPDKALAARLHSARPDLYRDDNHKPEMAIGLSEFEALCGFKPLTDIADTLERVPELRDLVGAEVSSSFVEVARAQTSHVRVVNGDGGSADSNQQHLRNLFATLIQQPSDAISSHLSACVARLTSNGETVASYQRGTPEELVLRLNGQFPGDIGCFGGLLLNYVTLQPGEALFLGANEPHAYLSGDCIECMASSDNVVRAGLTPKLKDVAVLVSMLTYTARPASEQILHGTPVSKSTMLYAPPVPEFRVWRTELEPGTQEEHEGVCGPSILLVTEGEVDLSYDGEEGGVKLEKASLGSVFYAAPGVQIGMLCKGSSRTVVYRAFCEMLDGSEMAS